MTLKNTTIFWREDRQRWVGMIDVTEDGSGRRKRKSLFGRTRDEVEGRLVAELAKRQAGVPISTDRRQSVSIYLRAWLHSKRSLRPSTGRRYASLVETHLIPRLGRHALVDLLPRHVEGVMAGMVEDGVSAQTAMHARGVLRTALHDAQREGLLVRNVASLARPVKVARRRVKVLTPDEVRQLLAVIEDDPLAPLITFALGTGARQGECLALRWSDVAEDYSGVTFSHGMYRRQLAPLKTADSARTVRLPRYVQAALKRQRLQQMPSADDYVFTTSLGTALDGTSVTHTWHRLQERVGWAPRMRFHDLRHGAASLALASGATMKEVQDMLGHSTMRLTADLYTHLLPQAKQDLADRMDALLEAAAE